MPSFTRRVPAANPLPTGCHISPSSGIPILPTGLPSLDDLLGGGLPLHSVLAVLAPDTHSAWGRLVERYFIAQGLTSGQEVVCVGEKEECEGVVGGCMWVDPRAAAAAAAAATAPGTTKGTARGDARSTAADGSESEGEVGGQEDSGRTRIAWRYDSMGKFQTSVAGSSNGLSLLHTIPPAHLRQLEAKQQLRYISLSAPDEAGPSSRPASRVLSDTLRTIHADIASSKGKNVAKRYIIHELGSADWGLPSASDIHRFLHSLKELLRDFSASVLLTLPPWLIRSAPDGANSREEWVRDISWDVDASVELRGFGDDPTLPLLFAGAHGTLHLHSFPTSHTLLPATLRHSTLLGVSSSGSAAAGGGGGGAGENNLSFRLKRKAFVIERLHLGVEGGVGERRTAPPPETRESLPTTGTATAASGAAEVEGVDRPTTTTPGLVVLGTEDKPRGPPKELKKRSRVRFGPEEEIPEAGEEVVAEVSVQVGRAEEHDHDHGPGPGHGHGHSHTAAKKVGIRHDRMDLYDF